MGAPARLRRSEAAPPSEIAAGRLRLQAFGVTEPASGTDTGALQTSARRGARLTSCAGKRWTSRAEHSGLMLLIASAGGVKKTDGLSALIVDMPGALGHGLTIRPIRKMMNHATTEVFLWGLHLRIKSSGAPCASTSGWRITEVSSGKSGSKSGLNWYLLRRGKTPGGDLLGARFKSVEKFAHAGMVITVDASVAAPVRTDSCVTHSGRIRLK